MFGVTATVAWHCRASGSLAEEGSRPLLFQFGLLWLAVSDTPCSFIWALWALLSFLILGLIGLGVLPELLLGAQ